MSQLSDSVCKAYRGVHARLAEELAKVVEKWEKVGFLDGLDSPYVIGQMAIILENQRLIRESIKLPDAEAARMRLYHETQIEMVRRIFDPSVFVGFDLVSVQVMLGPAGPVYYIQDGVLNSDDWCAKTRRLKTDWFYSYQGDPLSVGEQAEYGFEFVEQKSWDVAQEINREILKDIWNNAGILMKRPMTGDPAVLYKYMEEMRERSPHRVTWAVTTPEVASVFRSCGGLREGGVPSRPLGVRKVGRMWNLFDLYEDPLLPDCILTGYRGDSVFDCPYIYGSYVPLTVTPVIIDPSTFVPRHGLMTRYAKKLIKDGRAYYGRIDLKP